MTAKRKIYLVSVVPAPDQKGTPLSVIGSGPCYVYGDEDLERRKKAAEKAGVVLNIQPAPEL